MSYGAIINLPNGIVLNGATSPFAFVDVLSLTTTTGNGSKTYTGFPNRNIAWYQNYQTPFFNSGALPSRYPIGLTLSQTRDGSGNPILNWSTTIPSGSYLVNTTVYVIIY